jgi:secreted PhoX family phosphatase
MTQVDRRTFLRRSAALTGGLAAMGPLHAYAARGAMGQTIEGESPFGPLINMGDLSLPRGFRYKVISRQGDIMTDGNPTPGIFDGMAAYRLPKFNDGVVLIRNHENREQANEIPVVVPADKLYDPLTVGGNTKLVVNQNLDVVESYAVLGGTSTNCAGGQMPWGSWVTCEEVFKDGEQPHGYCFEVPADATGPVDPIAIKQAGRFSHEACVWFDGALYQTEDRDDNAALYRYVPDQNVRASGQLAASTGVLQALAVVDASNYDTRTGQTVGAVLDVEWVDIDEPDPVTDTVRVEAQSKGAAMFDRQEGTWVGGGKIFFDCTSAGDAGLGQVWELDPIASRLTLIYESPGEDELKNPDNIVVTPFGHLFLQEDSDPPQYIRGLTPDGMIYDFCRGETNESEFCGGCFDPSGRIFFVSQQGGRPSPEAVTFAITGPWRAGRATG